MEQKNWSVVRRTVWYPRDDTEEEVLLMNTIYQSLRLFTNFFLPVMQFTHKTWQGAKVTRSYDTPCPPMSVSWFHPASWRKQRRHSGLRSSILTPSLSMRGSLQMNGTCGSLSSPGTKTNPTSFREKAREWQLYPGSRRF